MTKYYASVEFAPGRWSPIVPSGDGAPHYRAAMEGVAEVVAEISKDTGEAPAGLVKVLVDLTSVDLTTRDDVMALIAYDPLFKTVFEFGRHGGVGATPEEASRMAAIAGRPPVDKAAGIAARLGSIEGYVPPADQVDPAEAGVEVQQVMAAGQERLALETADGYFLQQFGEALWDRLKMTTFWSEREDDVHELASVAASALTDVLGVRMTRAVLDPIEPGEDSVVRSAAFNAEGELIAQEDVEAGDLVEFVMPGLPTHPIGHTEMRDGKLMEWDGYGWRRSINREALSAHVVGSKDDAGPNAITDAIIAASSKGARLQTLHDFKPLLDLAIDKLLANAQHQAGKKMHPDSVRQMAHAAYGQARQMLQALGVSAAELDAADISD